MAWMVDTYIALNPGQIDAAAWRHGKARFSGGHQRPQGEATGRGLFYALREA